MTRILVPSGGSTQNSYPADSSPLQSSALNGQGTHRFFLDGLECVVNLRNSTAVSAVIQCEGRAPYDVVYPDENGCLPTYLLDGITNGQIFYVGFLGPCIPLRVQVSGNNSTPLQVRVKQEFKRDLSGKEVVVLKGEDEYQLETVYYAFIEDNGVVFKSTGGFRAADIEDNGSSCSTLSGLLPLPTHATHPGTLGLIVSCVHSTGAALRFLVYYSQFEGDVVHSYSISQAGGDVMTSDNGAFLAILHRTRDGMYSIILYNVPSWQQTRATPTTVSYDRPIRLHFLRHGNDTFLAVFMEGSNVKLVDAALFLSEEDLVDIPNTTVSSHDPCPYADIVAGDYFMVVVFNPLSFLYDLSLSKMGSRAVSTIPRVASTPPVLLFSQLEEVPDSSTTAAATTEPGEVTTSPFPLWAIIIPVVAGLAIICGVLLALVLCVCWRRRRCNRKSKSPPIQVTDPHPTSYPRRTH